MTANELIEALRALPAQDRELPVCGYEMSMLVELEPPRVGYRNHDNWQEIRADRRQQRVIVL